ncbi:MAG TPA: hypothetical protein VGC36_01365 [Rhizomicrobium sp.]
MDRFEVHAVDRLGRWGSDYRRHYESAAELVVEFAEAQAQYVATGLPQVVKRGDVADDVFRVGRRRDRLASSVTLFSAMSVEAFLNLFGVVSLGETVHNQLFQRMTPASRKLTALLLVGAQLSPKPNDELLQVFAAIVTRRHDLVHPVAVDAHSSTFSADGVTFEESVHRAWADCRQFFKLFGDAVPAARIHFERFHPPLE